MVIISLTDNELILGYLQVFVELRIFLIKITLHSITCLFMSNVQKKYTDGTEYQT